MKELVIKYLNKDLSRRSFIKSMVATGFSLATAESVLNRFKPLVYAGTQDKVYAQ